MLCFPYLIIRATAARVFAAVTANCQCLAKPGDDCSNSTINILNAGKEPQTVLLSGTAHGGLFIILAIKRNFFFLFHWINMC